MSEYQWEPAPFSERLANTVEDVARAGVQRGKQAAHGVASAARCLNDAIDYARQPGRPLDIIATVTRKAPLTSVLAAFVIGVAVARRR